MPSSLCLSLVALLVAPCAAFTPAAAALRPSSPAAALRRAAAPLLVEAETPLSESELQVQSAKLDALSAKWEKRQEEIDYAESLRSGWGPSPERINGRFAMFFLVVGLITEYYTGQSVPQQVYTMLQTLSIIDVRLPPACHRHCCASSRRTRWIAVSRCSAHRSTSRLSLLVSVCSRSVCAPLSPFAVRIPHASPTLFALIHGMLADRAEYTGQPCVLRLLALEEARAVSPGALRAASATVRHVTMRSTQVQKKRSLAFSHQRWSRGRVSRKVTGWLGSEKVLCSVAFLLLLFRSAAPAGRSRCFWAPLHTSKNAPK